MRLALVLLLSLMAFPVHAGEEDCDGCETDVIDTEPNWDTGTYKCPLSVKTEKGEHLLRHYAPYFSRDKLSILKPLPRKYIYSLFPSGYTKEDESIFLGCGYEGLDTDLFIRTKDVTACGGTAEYPLRAMCWTTDPYAR